MALTESELLSLKPGDVVEHKYRGEVTVRNVPRDLWYVDVGDNYVALDSIIRIVSRAAEKPGPAERCFEAHLAERKANKDFEDAMIELLASSPEEISKYTELLRQRDTAS